MRDSRSGRGLLRLKVDGDYLPAACFSPDGTRLLTSSRFRQPRVWDLKTGRSLFTLEGHTRAVMLGVAFSPDGRQIVTGGYDLTTRLWDSETGRPLKVLAGADTSWADAVGFSPDNRLVATGAGDGVVKLWSATDGREMISHATTPWATTLSRDGKLFTTGRARRGG